MSEPASALLEIRHVTGFIYDGFAESSYNEARMTPPTLPRQDVFDARLRVHPHAVQSTYRDYFGTIVTTFDLHESHHRLEVVAEATVQTMAERHPGQTLTMDSLREPHVIDRFAEYLAATTRTTLLPTAVEEVRERATLRDDVDSNVQSVMDAVRDRVAYVRGSTLVSSTAREVWDQRQGVCQDLTHVTISMLRALGIPARYVSGYLHSKTDAGIGEKVTGESHAWVEYFNGDWTGIDPTNGSDIGVHHVIVAKGREYGDVPPLKGIYNGGPSSALGVTVEITRIG